MKLTNRRRTALASALLAFALAVPAAGVAGEPAGTNNDPLGGLNRPIFRFNDALDRGVLEPVAKGYAFVMPDLVEGWVSNFFGNLWFPVNFANCVLQGKPQEATQTTARFILNTTIGLGGFGDPATKLSVPAPQEDFGQTLGYWGVPPGPYLVLPFLGPANIRDTAGRFADNAARVWPWFVPWYASSGPGVVDLLNTRARYLDDIRDLRESSIDYYAAVRNAYTQRRQALVEDRVGAGSGEERHLKSEDDLYFPDNTADDTPSTIESAPK